MIYTVVFMTTHGLCFYKLEEINLRRLIDAATMIRNSSEPPYRFVVTVDSDGKSRDIECSDIFVDFRAFTR